MGVVIARSRSRVVTLELYTPHKAQLAFHNSKARFRVASWGRQSGKSTACINELLKRAWEKPQSKYWYLSPIHSQARQQFRRMASALHSCEGAVTKLNESELMVQLMNGSQITFKSGESLHHLRGESLNGAVIDEVRDQDPNLWSQVIRPMLTTTQGWAAFVSTPNGFDEFFDLYSVAEKNETGLWECFQAPSTANPMFTKQEYDQLEAEMHPDLFAQEVLAQFRDLTKGRAYSNYGAHNERKQCPFTGSNDLYHPRLPIIVAMDFNITPMSWTLGQRAGNTTWWFDEIHLENSHTQMASQELITRLKAFQTKANPQVVIVGDATGKAQQRAAAGKSDYSIVFEALQQAGITYEDRTPMSNPAIKDRVNAVNNALRSANGTVSLYLHPEKVPHLRKDFQRVTWKPGATAILDPGVGRMLTHASDGVGYAVHELNPIRHGGDIGTLRVLAR